MSSVTHLRRPLGIDIPKFMINFILDILIEYIYGGRRMYGI